MINIVVEQTDDDWGKLVKELLPSRGSRNVYPAPHQRREALRGRSLGRNCAELRRQSLDHFAVELSYLIGNSAIAGQQTDSAKVQGNLKCFPGTSGVSCATGRPFATQRILSS
jgi:hypothetical protein